ncbi:uncharacterized protein LOC132755679 [Ruditapes philippinarum]|uniref:uncharacterized protein LOC132755679 n=1 Tax=Ruditapes philippinarum TaxID=129788 RepID=UPI00295C01CB|nr:uncharacterized protein LOC132755679 [Ruditapes philippinarum]
MKKCILLIFVNVVLSSTQDLGLADVSCNKNLLTWQQAVKECVVNGRELISFETGLGKKLEELDLKSDVDIWTADYLTSSNSGDRFCGFRYLNSTLMFEYPKEIYGNCNESRTYLRIQETGEADVFNSPREIVGCHGRITTSIPGFLSSAVKPGYYWTSEILNGRLVQGTEGTSVVLCGAYKSSIGRYYAECTGKRVSLCSINGSDSWILPRNKHCFGYESATPFTDTDTSKNVNSGTITAIIVIPVAASVVIIPGICVVILLRKRLSEKQSQRPDKPMNVSNLTTVSEQNDYDFLEQRQLDEHEYCSAKQVHNDRVGMNIYVKDVSFTKNN